MTQIRRSLLVARRELRDSLSDWRIVAPVAILSLLFPWIIAEAMSFGIRFAERYDPGLVLTQMIPFSVMIAGFFPISFSLVIALESFVGEKERNTLEALLSTPITDEALYVGKLMAALALPLIGSLTAIGLYTFALPQLTGQSIPLDLLGQILCLTITLALGMVAGAVVVSSNTTSVRAANLLASFIVLPATLVVGFQSIVILMGQREVLWHVALGLALADLALVRMGSRLFNREELLSRTLDRIDIRRAWHTFTHFIRQEPMAPVQNRPSEALSLGRLYRRDLPQILRRSRGATIVLVLLLVGALALGWIYAQALPLPDSMVERLELSLGQTEGWQDLLQNAGFGPGRILRQNVVNLTLAALGGIVSFGTIAVVPLFTTFGLVGFLAAQAAHLGLDLGRLAALIWPHGILEIPAAFLCTAAGLRMGAAMLSPPKGFTLGETLLSGLADFVKLLVLLIVPLLLLASFVEVYITPWVALQILGG